MSREREGVYIVRCETCYAKYLWAPQEPGRDTEFCWAVFDRSGLEWESKGLILEGKGGGLMDLYFMEWNWKLKDFTWWPQLEDRVACWGWKWEGDSKRKVWNSCCWAWKRELKGTSAGIGKWYLSECISLHFESSCSALWLVPQVFLYNSAAVLVSLGKKVKQSWNTVSKSLTIFYIKADS